MEEVARTLASLRDRGVRLREVDGNLAIEGPKGALTATDLDVLKCAKAQVLVLLRASTQSAPLAYSQLAYWNSHQLVDRPSRRLVTSVMDVRGRLDIQTARRAFEAIVARHSALRTRIVVRGGVPEQWIEEANSFELRYEDLTATPPHALDGEIRRLINAHILEPVDVAEGPLFTARVIEVRSESHVIIVSMEHIISDATSLQVVWNEFFDAYAAISIGEENSLRRRPLQFSEYAIRQRDSERALIEQHGNYWTEHLHGTGRMRFPADSHAPDPTLTGWEGEAVWIGPELTHELLQWARVHRTTAAMATLTAYVALVLRWCSLAGGVMQYQSDGRGEESSRSGIGYFATTLHLRVSLRAGEGFPSLSERVLEEYCSAFERVDASFLEAQHPRPDFTRSTCFNWVPRNALGDERILELPSGRITASPMQFEHPGLPFVERETEPMLLLFEGADAISGSAHYPRNRFSSRYMQRFCANFRHVLALMVRQPNARPSEIALIPSAQ